MVTHEGNDVPFVERFHVQRTQPSIEEKREMNANSKSLMSRGSPTPELNVYLKGQFRSYNVAYIFHQPIRACFTFWEIYVSLHFIYTPAWFITVGTKNNMYLQPEREKKIGVCVRGANWGRVGGEVRPLEANTANWMRSGSMRSDTAQCEWYGLYLGILTTSLVQLSCIYMPQFKWITTYLQLDMRLTKFLIVLAILSVWGRNVSG